AGQQELQCDPVADAADRVRGDEQAARTDVLGQPGVEVAVALEVDRNLEVEPLRGPNVLLLLVVRHFGPRAAIHKGCSFVSSESLTALARRTVRQEQRQTVAAAGQAPQKLRGGRSVELLFGFRLGGAGLLGRRLALVGSRLLGSLRSRLGLGPALGGRLLATFVGGLAGVGLRPTLALGGGGLGGFRRS